MEDSLAYKMLQQLKDQLVEIGKKEKTPSFKRAIELANEKLDIVENGLPKKWYRIECVKRKTITLEVETTSKRYAAEIGLEGAKKGHGIESEWEIVVGHIHNLDVK